MRWRTGAYQLYHLMWIGLDLLLPPTCGGCGKVGSRWCPRCQKGVRGWNAPICEVCGISVKPGVRICTDCRRSRPRFRVLRSWAVFEDPIRTAIHRLKYRKDVGLGEALAPHLGRLVAGLGWCVDLLVPVPLGMRRLGERGYNQSELIGFPLSLALDLAYAPRAMVRTRETRSQVGLNRDERRANVRLAFEADPRWVNHQRILLLDDVATTGATLDSCADALHTAGASEVFAITVARARHRQSALDA